MSVAFDELMNEEEMYSESIRKANDRYMECLRERAFPTPSPFGVEWEKQRVAEAYTLIARWSQGRKGKGRNGDTASFSAPARSVLFAPLLARAGNLPESRDRYQY